ncbi:MAG: hypothetical protein V3V15_11350 [Sphingorhabdus sp.]
MSVGVVYNGSGLSTIDAKGRATIPSALRDSVQQSSGGNIVCLSRHPIYPCLIGFGLRELNQMRDDIDEKWKASVARGEDFDREAAGASASSMFETNFEASGRFVLQPMLRFFSKVEDSAFFHGTYGNFLVWNPDIFLSDGPSEFGAQKDELRYWQQETGKRIK